MRETRFNNSTATIGTVAFSRSAWIGLPTPWEVVSAAAGALEAVGASEAASAVVADLEVAVVSEAVVAALVAATAVATVEALAVELPAVVVPDMVGPRPHPWLPTLSPISQPPTGRGARSSLFAT